MLLSPTGELPPSVAEEIARLGAVRAIIVGTTGAFPETFDEALAGAGITTVERIEGSDRFDTAAQVARQLPGSAAVLAQGIDSDPSRGWPDALAGAALAATRGVPILLTEQGTLPPATLAAVTDLGLEQITIVGGEAAVAPAVATQLEGAGATVDRVAGSNRFETAVAAAFRAVDAFSDPVLRVPRDGTRLARRAGRGPGRGADRRRAAAGRPRRPGGQPGHRGVARRARRSGPDRDAGGRREPRSAAPSSSR